MKKKDILGLIGAELTRNKEKKPKKSLDDYLVGEEDRHEQVMNKKRNPETSKKKNSLTKSVGVSHGEDKEGKPTIDLLDFGKLNKMSPRDQVKTLKREYLNLIDKMEEVSERAVQEQSSKSEVQIELQKYKRENKSLKEFLREVAGFIPDAHELKVTMDTSEWAISDIEMELTSKVKSLVNKVKFAEKAVEEEINEVVAQKKALENELHKARKMMEEIKNQKHEYIPMDNDDENDDEKENETKVKLNKNEDEEVKEKRKSPFDEKPNIEEQPKHKKQYSDERTEDDDLPKYVFMDVDRYIENLPESGKFVLEVIGATGISRNSELKNHIEALELSEGKKHFYSGGKFDYNQLNSSVKLLKDRQFLTSQEVNLKARGHKFPVYELSDIGKAVYYKSTQLKPVEPESAQIRRDHKSLEHGYLIKDCAVEFREMGYTVYEDRENCTYKLKNNKRKVFDLIIEKDGEKKHIEVEMGTHNEDDFLTAMDKIYEVTSDFYFVAPNQKILYTNTKGKVFSWITDRLGGFEAAKGKIKLNFATFENIKKRQKQIWEEFKL